MTVIRAGRRFAEFGARPSRVAPGETTVLIDGMFSPACPGCGGEVSLTRVRMLRREARCRAGSRGPPPTAEQPVRCFACAQAVESLAAVAERDGWPSLIG